MKKVVTRLLQSCDNIVYNAYDGDKVVGKWNYRKTEKIGTSKIVIHSVDFASSPVRFTELYKPAKAWPLYTIVADFFLSRRTLSNKHPHKIAH